MSTSTRQLAAIMFTDIAGYTALMGEDENKGIEILRKNKKLQKPLIERYGGIWLKEMGDGVLASFNSAYQAVKCAIDIQQTASEELKNRIRIGIHLGDVTVEGKDVIGDGVNIASRLESIADPGGVYVSEAVVKAIRSNIEISAQYLGDVQLKNVSDKVGVYAISSEGLTVPTRKKIRELSRLGSGSKYGLTLRLFLILIFIGVIIGAWFYGNKFFFDKKETIQSLAILPFSNYSGDETQTFLVSGIHDALISELGQLEMLRVTAKQSILQYANSQKTIGEIASELNVDAIIEGSVLSTNDSIRIQLKLISAFPEERLLWTQTFNTDLGNILNVYGQVTKNIAREIQLELSPEEETLLAKSRSVDPDAYEAYLQGRFQLGFLTREGQVAALNYFKRSVEIDPEYAPAYGGMMGVYIVLKQMDFISTEEANPLIEEYYSIATELDSQNAEIYFWAGLKKVWTDYDWTSGEQSFKRCIQINPNYSLAWAYYSHLMMILKRPVEMRKFMSKALEIDPNNITIQLLNIVELMIASEYDSCINQAKYLQTITPKNPMIAICLFLSYAETGKYDEAIHVMANHLKQIADEKVAEILLQEYSNSGFRNAMHVTADTWVDRSDTTFAVAQWVAMLYAYAGNTDKTLDWVEEGHLLRDSDIPYIGVLPHLRPYQNNPRFVEIMQTMNLPQGAFKSLNN